MSADLEALRREAARLGYHRHEDAERAWYGGTGAYYLTNAGGGEGWQAWVGARGWAYGSEAQALAHWLELPEGRARRAAVDAAEERGRAEGRAERDAEKP